MISYPSGEITYNQSRRLIEGDEPFIAYTSYDGSATWHLMGPLSPIVGVQEGVIINAESIRGMIPTWRTLDQAGANQDGVTFNDAVYQPTEIDMMVEAHGNTPEQTRQVIRDWVGSWDAHRTGELSVFTRESGMWWADVRWLKAPTDSLMRASSLRQKFLWTARIDDSFWRSFDSVSTFGFAYEDFTDTFNYGSSQATDLGANWPLYYTGLGGGYIYAAGSQAVWRDSDQLFGTQSREVVAGPYANFNTDTDNQVVSMVLGTIPEVSLPVGAFNDLWARMGRNPDGSWNGYGVRARIGWGYVELAYFSGFHPSGDPIKTILASRPLILPPIFGEKFTLVAGADGDPRLFKMTRNGVDILVTKEVGTGSSIGVPYRGVGFGMFAAAALITQATPANVRKISAGDNSTVSQQTFVQLTNIGDVEGWPRYLVYGPGNFSIGNPLTDDMVEFGPLLAGQVVLIETEPRRRAVVDVSPTQLPEQVLNPFQALVKGLVTFATNNNVPPLLREFESLFGILPPQANLYSLLNGRFTQPLPPKPPGTLGVTVPIQIRIDDGNASSKVVAAVTPRRRWPM